MLRHNAALRVGALTGTSGVEKHMLDSNADPYWSALHVASFELSVVPHSFESVDDGGEGFSQPRGGYFLLRLHAACKT